MLQEKRGSCRDLVGKPEGKRSLGRPRLRLEDNIKIYLQEIGLGNSVHWIDTSQDRGKHRTVLNTAMNCRFP
jgi:hypothetical protein